MNKTALAALVVCAVFAFSGVQAVWATDYTWVNTTPTGSGQSWSTVSSWKVGDETATDYPKTTADNADLSLRPAAIRRCTSRRVRWGSGL